MKPIHTDSTTVVLAKPHDWDERLPCGCLPIHKGFTDEMFSWWHCTWKELFKLAMGGSVRLCVVGRTHPVIALQVTKEGE